MHRRPVGQCRPPGGVRRFPLLQRHRNRPRRSGPLRATGRSPVSVIPLAEMEHLPDTAGCHCCPQAPPAPEPRGGSAGESRPDPGRNTEAGWLDLGGVFRPFIGPVPADSQPAADNPPLSTQFPASDLKSPLHRGHRSACVRRPYSVPVGLSGATHRVSSRPDAGAEDDGPSRTVVIPLPV